MKQYNALFIIDPEKEGSLKEITSSIQGIISRNEGRIDKEENWGKQKLSYPVKKKTDGIYYKLEFSLPPSAVKELNKSYKLDSNILRVMITERQV